MSDIQVPIRAITHGPKFHWYSYYDKLQFGHAGRYVLAMEVDFEHRSPRPDDVVRLGMIDLTQGDRWVPLGETRSWCWQQGCMLQWIPGARAAGAKVIWNDRDGDNFVSRVMDVATLATKTIPFPIYTVSPDGAQAVSPDFSRIQDMYPGYGYAGPPDLWKDDLAPEESGIYNVDLLTGRHRLIISVAQVAAIPYPHADTSGCKHYFNHLLFNQDGSRFIFLDRWLGPEGQPWVTRMITAAPDGSDLRVVDDYGQTSHFIWRDPQHILAWGWHPLADSAFYLYDETSREVEPVGKGIMTRDGHCSYLAGDEWILCDSYPDGEQRQELYLFHVPTESKVTLGRFLSPRAYRDEWRCDLHPRSSPDGRMVTIDSPHEGGRQIYLLDVSGIVG